MAKKTFGKGKLGSGSRFANCVKQQKKNGASNPEAICAAIGRKTYGAKKFATLGSKGK